MAKFEVTKTVEARKLHPKSGIPLSEPAEVLPFGAILENLREERDLLKFTYLGKPYQCEQKLLKPAIRSLGGKAPAAMPAEGEPVPQGAPEAQIRWETLRTSNGSLLRAKVPGGWLLTGTSAGGPLTFYPDAKHEWDGRSLG